MAFEIPKNTVYNLKEGDGGIVVWALQRTCNKLGIPTTEDGAFGPGTTTSVKSLQRKMRTAQDGVVGPKTQEALRDFLTKRQEGLDDLPGSFLRSQIIYESGGYLGAVNWSVAGGVDCGLAQRRVYDEDYDDQGVIKRAFDAIYQLGLMGGRAQDLRAIFLSRKVIRKSETAWRCVSLAHNYPALADKISRVGFKGLSTYYTSTQSWVTIHNLKFPDGHPVRTPLEWGQRYALGNPEHDEPGQAVKLVKW